MMTVKKTEANALYKIIALFGMERYIYQPLRIMKWSNNCS